MSCFRRLCQQKNVPTTSIVYNQTGPNLQKDLVHVDNSALVLPLHFIDTSVPGLIGCHMRQTAFMQFIYTIHAAVHNVMATRLVIVTRKPELNVTPGQTRTSSSCMLPVWLS